MSLLGASTLSFNDDGHAFTSASSVRTGPPPRNAGGYDVAKIAILALLTSFSLIFCIAAGALSCSHHERTPALS